MNERGPARRQIGPEERVLELKPHGAGQLASDLGHDELPVVDLGVDPRPVEFALFPHHDAEGIHPLRRLAQHGLDTVHIGRRRGSNPDLHPATLPHGSDWFGKITGP